MNTANKPVVGIVMCQQLLDDHPTLTLGQKYLDALLEAGALPIPLIQSLALDESLLQQALAMLDGIMLTGSPSNIEPHHYGAQGDEPHTDPGRDRLSLRLIQAARVQHLPLLGICRGFQEMVVASGGSLHRRLDETGLYCGHKEDASRPLAQQYGPAHDIRLCKEGLLSRLVNTWVHQVNSLHMQGVNSLGDGVRVEAKADDGLVEAISFIDHPFALGVQWHPEWQSRNDALSCSLFDRFIVACRQYRSSREGI